MSRVATYAWLGALGPPFAWATQHVAGYAVGLSRCPDGAAGAGLTTPVDALTVIIGGFTAVIAALCGVGAFAAWRSTRDADDDDAPPAGRVHFLSVIGLTITPLFLAMIVMSSAGAVVFQDCTQS